LNLYTEEDFGVAYAYWMHLLRPVQDDYIFSPLKPVSEAVQCIGSGGTKDFLNLFPLFWTAFIVV
jgi:hypothetical protein